MMSRPESAPTTNEKSLGKRVRFNDKVTCKYILQSEFLPISDEDFLKNKSLWEPKLVFLSRIEKFEYIFRNVSRTWAERRELLEMAAEQDEEESESDDGSGESKDGSHIDSDVDSFGDNDEDPLLTIEFS